MSIPRVFVDTVAWIGEANRADALHSKVRKCLKSLRKQKALFVTTEFVLFEVANGLSKLPFRQVAVRYLEQLRSLPDLRIVPFSQSLLALGWVLWGQRLDKEWSLTDCISFEVMKQEQIAEALTSDHHFEQAGFAILL
jgi:predicted nucleic acid-binding protein